MRIIGIMSLDFAAGNTENSSDKALNQNQRAAL